MIGFLQGRPMNVEGDTLLLNVHGVGYELSCSQQTLSELEGQEIVEAWVYTHVREDAIHLFGFATPIEKQLFLSLIKVNGVGPKLALNVLSASRLEMLVQMIEEADAKGLAKLPKIGKKTAEQIILSLKGKLVQTDSKPIRSSFPARSEIVSALVHLGFRVNDVEEVVNKMDPKTDLQAGVRSGLAALTGAN